MALSKEQLTIAEQFVKAMQAISTYAEKTDAALKSQAESMKQVSEGFAAPDTKQFNSQLSEASAKIKELVDTLTNMSKSGIEAFGGMSKGSKAASKSMVEYAKKVAYSTAAVSGLKQGLKNVVAVLQSAGSLATGFVDSIWEIGKAIVAIPFKMFKGLLDIANGVSGANELAVAMENLREQFGAFTGPTSKAVIDLSVSLKGFSDTGLSAWRVFGNLAQRIEEFTKLATAMGASFDNVRKEFVENGGALLAYQKGLGLAEEDMKTFADRSISMGEKMGDGLKDVTKYADSMGKAFGMDAKVISRSMVKAAADVKHFGNSTVKELSIAVAYSKKLGVELDKILGVMDAFETFDSAAESAAKLSQSFGVQVDAFKMMEAQNPAEQIEMLRDQMKAAGQDASTFNRQQLKLLSSTTGLDEATARQVFSQKNQGKSLQEIQAQAGKAEKKTLTQAEAMEKLADSIKRLVQSGGGNQGGFFDRFFKGFLGGIQSSKEFQSIILNINRALMKVEMIGVQLGRTFVKAFPGVKDFFDGISEFFGGGNIEKMFSGFTRDLSWFFKEVHEGRFSFGELMKKLQADFFDFFDSKTRTGKKTVDGLKEFFHTFVGILGAGIAWAGDQVGKALGGIADAFDDFSKDPSKKMKGAAGAVSGGAKVGMGMMKPIIDGIVKGWESLKKPLGRIIVQIIKGIVSFLGSEEVKTALKPMIPILVGLFVGPAVTRTLLTVGTQALGKSLFGMIKGVFTSPAATAGTQAGAKAMGGTLTKIFGSAAKYVTPAAAVIAIGAAAVSISDAIDTYQDDLEDKFGKTEAKIGAASTGLIDALTLGLLPKDMKKNIAAAIAEAAKSVFDSITKSFGADFSKSLKDYVGGSIDIFKSLGTLIKSMFNGDEDQIAAAFIDLGKKLLFQVGNALKFMIEGMPKLAIWAAKFATKFAGMLFGSIGKAFKSGKDIPVIGVLLEGVGKLFEIGSRMFKWVSSIFGSISDYFSEKGGILRTVNDWLMKVGKWFSDTFANAKSAIVDPLSSAWKSIKETWGSVKTWFTDNVWTPVKSVFGNVTDTVKKSFSDAWTAVTDIFSVKTFVGLITSIVDGIEKALKKMLDIPVFKDFITVAKKAFDIHSPSGVFMDIGDQVVAGLDKGLASMPSVVSKRMNESATAAKAAAPSIVSQASAAANSKTVDIKRADETTQKLMSLQKKASEMSASIMGSSDSVIKDGLTPAVKAVEKMIDATQRLDDALSSLTLKPVNLKAKLGQVAKSMGLGGSAAYTVNSKPINMTVNMHVTMDTAEVERIMITNKSSVIRDRINFIGEKVPDLNPTKEPLFKIKTNATPATIKGGED